MTEVFEDVKTFPNFKYFSKNFKATKLVCFSLKPQLFRVQQEICVKQHRLVVLCLMFSASLSSLKINPPFSVTKTHIICLSACRQLRLSFSYQESLWQKDFKSHELLKSFMYTQYLQWDTRQEDWTAKRFQLSRKICQQNLFSSRLKVQKF